MSIRRAFQSLMGSQRNGASGSLQEFPHDHPPDQNRHVLTTGNGQLVIENQDQAAMVRRVEDRIQAEAEWSEREDKKDELRQIRQRVLDQLSPMYAQLCQMAEYFSIWTDDDYTEYSELRKDCLVKFKEISLVQDQIVNLIGLVPENKEELTRETKFIQELTQPYVILHDQVKERIKLEKELAARSTPSVGSEKGDPAEERERKRQEGLSITVATLKEGRKVHVTKVRNVKKWDSFDLAPAVTQHVTMDQTGFLGQRPFTSTPREVSSDSVRKKSKPRFSQGFSAKELYHIERGGAEKDVQDPPVKIYAGAGGAGDPGGGSSDDEDGDDPDWGRRPPRDPNRRRGDRFQPPGNPPPPPPNDNDNFGDQMFAFARELTGMFTTQVNAQAIYDTKQHFTRKFTGEGSDYATEYMIWLESLKRAREHWTACGKTPGMWLGFVKKSLAKSALKQVENLVEVDANYEIAIRILNEAYLNPCLAVKTILTQLIDLDHVKNTVENMNSCYSKLFGIIQRLEQLGMSDGDVANMLIMCLVERKLPPEVVKSWSRKVLRHQEFSDGDPDNPSYHGLPMASFLRTILNSIRENTFINYSTSDKRNDGFKSQSDHKKKPNPRKVDGLTYFIGGKSGPLCHICDNKKEHALGDCQNVRKMSVDERWKRLATAQRCCGCMDLLSQIKIKKFMFNCNSISVRLSPPGRAGIKCT